jgi:hypothetical protein
MWGQVAAHAAAHGARVSVADVCAVAAGSAQLTGAWVSAARNGEPDFAMYVTDLGAEELAELQLILGEGRVTTCWRRPRLSWPPTWATESSRAGPRSRRRRANTVPGRSSHSRWSPGRSAAPACWACTAAQLARCVTASSVTCSSLPTWPPCCCSTALAIAGRRQRTATGRFVAGRAVAISGLPGLRPRGSGTVVRGLRCIKGT